MAIQGAVTTEILITEWEVRIMILITAMEILITIRITAMAILTTILMVTEITMAITDLQDLIITRHQDFMCRGRAVPHPEWAV